MENPLSGWPTAPRPQQEHHARLGGWACRNAKGFQGEEGKEGRRERREGAFLFFFNDLESLQLLIRNLTAF